MTHVVVDASTLVDAVGGTSARDDSARARLGLETCHAPHLIDAELGQTLRRLVRADTLAVEVAERALALGGELIDVRHPHVGDLSRRAWALRDNLSFYDALYVALASQLDVPLLTADQKLANAPGLPCEVELV